LAILYATYFGKLRGQGFHNAKECEELCFELKIMANHRVLGVLENSSFIRL